MRGRNVLADPTLAGPIEDQGLLRVLEPENFVDDEGATKLAAIVEALLETGCVRRAPRDVATCRAVEESRRILVESAELAMSRSRFLAGGAELSMGRMRGRTWRPADEVLLKLMQRGLAQESKDGVSIPCIPACAAPICSSLPMVSSIRPRKRPARLRLNRVDDCLAAIAELPLLNSVPLCIGRQHFAQDLRATLDQGIPRPAHQLNLGTLAHSRDCRASTAGGCGPFAVPFSRPLRSVCGLQTNEQPRTRAKCRPARPSVFGALRPIFAAVRGSVWKSGRTVQIGLGMRFFGRLQRIYNGHAAPTPGFTSVQTGRMPCLTNVRCH